MQPFVLRFHSLSEKDLQSEEAKFRHYFTVILVVWWIELTYIWEVLLAGGLVM